MTLLEELEALQELMNNKNKLHNYYIIRNVLKEHETLKQEHEFLRKHYNELLKDYLELKGQK